MSKEPEMQSPPTGIALLQDGTLNLKFVADALGFYLNHIEGKPQRGDCFPADLRLAAEMLLAETPPPHTHVAVVEDPALVGIAETIKESGGHWKPCSGCYDTEDGYPTQRYPFSKALGCDVGCGCHECGGLGAVWEHWTEEDLVEFQRISDDVDREHKLEVRIAQLEAALRHISSPSQTTDLLWWQIEARAALATTEGSVDA